jgi:hypothetical protein
VPPYEAEGLGKLRYPYVQKRFYELIDEESRKLMRPIVRIGGDVDENAKNVWREVGPRNGLASEWRQEVMEHVGSAIGDWSHEDPCLMTPLWMTETIDNTNKTENWEMKPKTGKTRMLASMRLYGKSLEIFSKRMATRSRSGRF